MDKEGETGRQTNKQTQAGRQADRHTHTYTDKKRSGERKRG